MAVTKSAKPSGESKHEDVKSDTTRETEEKKVDEWQHSPQWETPSGISGTAIVMLIAVIFSSISVLTLAKRYPSDSPAGIDYVATSVVFFILLIFIEIILTKGKVYNLPDSASSISAGSLQQLFSVHVLRRYGFYVLPYTYIYQNYSFGLFDTESWAEYTVCFFVMDFGYYWLHRSAHEFQPFWWGHITHHSSEYYNLSTALRQGVMQVPLGALFYLPLALLFRPKVFFMHNQLNTLYQFWVHTQCIGKLGFLEYIISTPSSHRVHHDRRVHKNYGGVLIIWDIIFGSFAEETLEPGKRSAIYGVLLTPKSWNPFYCQVAQAWYIIKKAATTPGLSSKLRLLLSGPGWRKMAYRTVMPAAPEAAPNFRYHSTLSSPLIVYEVLHLAIAIALVNIFMVSYSAPLIETTVVGVAGLASLLSIGLINDNSPFALPFELARTVSLASVFAFAVFKAETLPFHLTHTALGVLSAFFGLSALIIALKPSVIQNVQVMKN